MKVRKSDWTLVKEAENQGLMVGMTGLVERKRTETNNELSTYFRTQLPNYNGGFDEYEGEDILYSINEYIKENGIDKHLLDFPMTNGIDIYLIPINDNIQLKVVIADEYYGDGDYAKYVMINFFMMSSETTKSDVDELINFVKKYILAAI